MTSEATRHVMQANKGKNTSPELKVRAALRAAGLSGYRLHWKKAPGHPDICYPGRKIAIFVNGCFWHRCPYCDLPMPKSNVEYWEAKFVRNRERDEREQEQLVADGWTVCVVWEHALKRDRIDATIEELVEIVAATPRGEAHSGSVIEVGETSARSGECDESASRDAS
jgi:DNA mismatch endonuclease (patch repair protein)